MELLRRYLFWILLAICVISFFSRNNLRTVSSIHPDTLGQPIQTELPDVDKITFDDNGYSYDITPLFNYTLNGLIVNKFTYDFLNIYKYGGVFPADLCIIWGSNIKNLVHLDQRITFSQDCRWCNVQWVGRVTFNQDDFSNNHLLVNNARIRKIIKGLSRGDQIQIKGKLVNVKATLFKKTDPLDAKEFQWKTSTIRTDTGAGACEVIYVEDIKILKKGNPLAGYMFFLTFYSLIALSIYKTFCFIRELRTD